MATLTCSFEGRQGEGCCHSLQGTADTGGYAARSVFCSLEVAHQASHSAEINN